MNLSDGCLFVEALSKYTGEDVSVCTECRSYEEYQILLRLRIGTALIDRVVSGDRITLFYEGFLLSDMLYQYFEANTRFYPDGYDGFCKCLTKIIQEDKNDTHRRDL